MKSSGFLISCMLFAIGAGVVAAPPGIDVPPVDPVEARDAYAGPAYSDKLLALFLKLSINDPNNSPETHQMLQEIASSLREQMLEAAQQKDRESNELAAEAETKGVAAGSRHLITVLNAHAAALKGLTEQERHLIRLRVGEEFHFGVIARILHLSGAEEAEKRFEESWAKYINLTKQFLARMLGIPDLWHRECSPPPCLD